VRVFHLEILTIIPKTVDYNFLEMVFVCLCVFRCTCLFAIYGTNTVLYSSRETVQVIIYVRKYIWEYCLVCLSCIEILTLVKML
jgi:hypothetical protein